MAGEEGAGHPALPFRSLGQGQQPARWHGSGPGPCTAQNYRPADVPPMTPFALWQKEWPQLWTLSQAGEPAHACRGERH